MSAIQILNFSEFNFWELPFEKNGFFLDIESDKYGIAAATVREALRGEGRQGVRKVRLLHALENGDESTACAEVAGIFRSALENSKVNNNAQATERNIERNMTLGVDEGSGGVDELFDRMAALPQAEREVSFFDFYFDNFFLYKREDWIFVAEKIGVNFDRIERIAGIKSPGFAATVCKKRQSAWVFTDEVEA